MNQKVTVGCFDKFDIDICYEEHSDRYIGEVLQHEEYSFLKKYLDKKKDLTIVDIGANIGTFSLYIYDIAKVIYSIEPFKEITTMLEQTIKDNALDKIKVFNMAIGPFTGKGLMNRIEPISAGGSFLSEKGDKETDVMTLNDFAHKEGINYIDLLKIDTEGGEKAIMESTDFEKLPVDCIIGEIHVGGINKDNFFGLLKQKGFNGIEFGGNRFLAQKL